MKSAGGYNSMTWVFVVAVVCVAGVTAFSPCSISKKYRGAWGLYMSYDGIDYVNQFNISITTNVLLGYKLDQFPSLLYDCYSTGRNSLAFRSEEALFFETYNVRVFFCWYLIKVNSNTYNIVELTSRIIEDSYEHAKAYLEENSLPDSSRVCEIPYSTKEGLYAPYKQLRKIISPTWS